MQAIIDALEAKYVGAKVLKVSATTASGETVSLFDQAEMAEVIRTSDPIEITDV